MTISRIVCAFLMGLALSACGTVGPDMPPASSVALPAERAPAAALYETDRLKADFKQFRRIMEGRTARLYTDRARLSAMLDEAEARLGSPMDELGFLRLLSPIVADLRCGHSFLSISAELERQLRAGTPLFPLGVRIFGDRLFVIADSYGRGIAPGSEILAINGRPASDIIALLMSNMTTDGRDQGRPRYDAERWFASLYYTYMDSSESFDMLLLGLTGATEGEGPVARTIAGQRDQALVKLAEGVIHDTTNAPYSKAYFPGYALLKIPSFSYSRPKAYEEFLKDFFAGLKSRGTGTLILDLRGNYGGSPAPTAALFRYLIGDPKPFFAPDNPVYLAPWKKEQKPYPEAFGGRLIVLMDEAGFSMNGFLLSLLKYHGIGTLIGARSAGGFACSDASLLTTLRNTGLRLRYSTQAFSVAVEGQAAGIGVEPDLSVEWTLKDYLAKRDPVMEAALRAAGVP
ncbi:MAG TPA: hypothetical protein DCG47_02775 [Spirochaetaceae bacterium]|jgi:hypothetical protein|nr:hypothetical protein [Spirochaetaceae bacterium]